MFLSSALVAPALLPSWMQTACKFIRVTDAVKSVRPLIASGFDWGTILQAYAVFAIILCVTWAAMLYQFRRVV